MESGRNLHSRWLEAVMMMVVMMVMMMMMKRKRRRGARIKMVMGVIMK